jgi:Ca-activated chloride channel family protein
MPRLSYKILLYSAAGALGGSAAWAFVLYVSGTAGGGLLMEVVLGALTGMFIGGFIWSHESITGRQFQAAMKRAVYGAAAGILGGAAGAALGNTVFTALGKIVVDAGGFRASLGIALAVGLGWAVLGTAIGISGGIMIRSLDRTLYGLAGGSVGGFLGGLLFTTLSATSIWSALAGLALLGLSIGAFISLVEEAFVSAKLKVIKGRHLGREFPLLKEQNVVGRDDRSDVCLSGAEGVGMQHALIKRKNGRYSIEADQKGRVVYVNHKLTRIGRLSDGDVIRVGSIMLMFSAVRKAAIAAAVMFILLGGIGLQGYTAWASDGAAFQITQFDLSAFPRVKAYTSILDAAGRPMRGLTKEDITLVENGHSVKIAGMQMSGAEGKREPLSFAIVLDKSGSMTGDKIAHAKKSVHRFISLMEHDDRASLFAFSDKVAMLKSLTNEQSDLNQAVQSIQPGGHTALFDGIARGVESVQGISGRRAVIVLSDGIANRGALDIEQAIESAMKANVSVYVIGLGEDVRTARLERIASETGGSYFFTPSADGLAEIYETISKRIRNEYAVSYMTEKRGEYLRKVSITLRSGQMATRSFFQPDSSLFGAGMRFPGWVFAVPLMSIAGLLAVSFRHLERSYPTGHLSLVRGKGTKQEIDVDSAVTIGRDERNTLGLFKDNAIAQHHADVVREEGHYIIEDKGSATGTLVNQKKIAGRHALKDGDIIDIGGTRIVFNEESRSACGGCGSRVRSNVKFCPKCGVKAA